MNGGREIMWDMRAVEPWLAAWVAKASKAQFDGTATEQRLSRRQISQPGCFPTGAADLSTHDRIEALGPI
jgi:hypothetical protein